MIALASSAPPIVSSPRAVAEVNSSMFWRVPGPAERESDGRHGLGVAKVRDPADGRHDRDRGLRAARDQRDLGCSSVLFEVDRRHDRRPERGGGEVDARDPVLGQQAGVLGMGVCRGRIERQVDALDQVEERRQAAVGGDMPVLASAPQPVRLRVDPCHAGQLQRGAPLDLDHEVGADVARADDGDAQRPAVRAHAGSGLRARRIGRGSGIRRKRSSRKGSRRSGRRPVVIISARARPDVGASVTPCIE